MKENDQMDKEQKMLNEITSLKEQLAEERKNSLKLREAYETAVKQNASLWGLLSNTINYVVSDTVKKENI